MSQVCATNFCIIDRYIGGGRGDVWEWKVKEIDRPENREKLCSRKNVKIVQDRMLINKSTNRLKIEG